MSARHSLSVIVGQAPKFPLSKLVHVLSDTELVISTNSLKQGFDYQLVTRALSMSDKVLRLTKGDELTWNNHDPSGDDRRWRMTQFAKLPLEFHRPIAKQYNYRFRKTGRTQANTFLRKFVNQFDVRTQRPALAG